MLSSTEFSADIAEHASSSASDSTKAYGKISATAAAARKNHSPGGFRRTMSPSVFFSRPPMPPRRISAISLLTDSSRK